MPDLKHVGRIISNKRKVIVAYRVVPGEPENCIVVTTENLPADEHDALMKLVESNAGQQTNDLAVVMARSFLPDGRIMLSHFHKSGKMIKMPSNQIELTPNRNTVIRLDTLNQMVAEKQGVSVEDLAIKSTEKSSKSTEINETSVRSQTPQTQEPLSNKDLAEKYMNDAETMSKEAKRLRKEAKLLLEQEETEEKVAE